jgi:hypothetical protein
MAMHTRTPFSMLSMTGYEAPSPKLGARLAVASVSCKKTTSIRCFHNPACAYNRQLSRTTYENDDGILR